MDPDPWKPLPPTNGSKIGLDDSQKYITSLENKLSRLKCQQRGRDVKAKDIVSGLTEAKSRQMLSFTQDTYTQSSVFVSEDDPLDTHTVGSIIQRRLQPEKQALTAEELKQLVDNDELDKQTYEIREQDENEINSEHDESVPTQEEEKDR